MYYANVYHITVLKRSINRPNAQVVLNSPQEQYQFLYTALEGAFPVQNGAIKTPTATDSAQVINETTALLTEANSTTGADQKKAEDSKATESSEQEAAENSAAAPSPAEGDGEKTTTEGTTNGPAVTTVEV